MTYRIESGDGNVIPLAHGTTEDVAVRYAEAYAATFPTPTSVTVYADQGPFPWGRTVYTVGV